MRLVRTKRRRRSLTNGPSLWGLLERNLSSARFFQRRRGLLGRADSRSAVARFFLRHRGLAAALDIRLEVYRWKARIRW